MKKCPYCGKEYPDSVAYCATDNTELPDPTNARTKVTGVWRGVFGYGQIGKQPEMPPVAFTLRLKQGWFDHFSGTVREDPPQGVPGEGVVEGYFAGQKIEFTKKMPVGYIMTTGDGRMTMREYVVSQGHKCDQELPPPLIFYQGTLLDSDRVQGTWTINARRIQLSDGSYISTRQTSGFWCAEFKTTNDQLDPDTGPTASLFDKSLLSPREIEEVEGVAFESIGKFSVPDAEKLMETFTRDDIRYELRRDDSGMRQTPPIMEYTGAWAGTALIIEIFVHPQDREKAADILTQNYKL